MMACPEHSHCNTRCGDDCTVPAATLRICTLHDCDACMSPMDEWLEALGIFPVIETEPLDFGEGVDSE